VLANRINFFIVFMLDFIFHLPRRLQTELIC